MTASRIGARALARLSIVLVCAFAGLASAGPKRWTLVELGSLPGTAGSEAVAVNVPGAVAGDSGGHGFVWRKGAMIDIGQPPGGDIGGVVVVDMNQHEQVLGYASSTLEAWTWQDGAWTDLGFQGLPGGINKSGDIVATVGSDMWSRRAVLLHKGSLTDLGTVGRCCSSANAINDRGQVVGSSLGSEAPFHAFLWERGVMKDLGAFEGHYTVANDINNRGEVVGYSYWFEHYRAWIYDGQMRLLVDGAIPTAINDHGDVVGTILDGPHPVGAFLYAHGEVTRIDHIPEVVAAAFVSVTVLDISDRGWIAGSGYKAGALVPSAFLLIPNG